MAKSIKQIADELGVSKTAVRKKIENLGLSEKLETVGNRILIDEQQEALIKSAFIKSETETRKPETNSENRALLELVSVLQKELEVKNEQIFKLQEQLTNTTAALNNAQESLKAAQIMQAQSQNLLEDKKRHWWNRRKKVEAEQ